MVREEQKGAIIVQVDHDRGVEERFVLAIALAMEERLHREGPVVLLPIGHVIVSVGYGLHEGQHHVRFPDPVQTGLVLQRRELGCNGQDQAVTGSDELQPELPIVITGHSPRDLVVDVAKVLLLRDAELEGIGVAAILPDDRRVAFPGPVVVRDARDSCFPDVPDQLLWQVQHDEHEDNDDHNDHDRQRHTGPLPLRVWGKCLRRPRYAVAAGTAENIGRADRIAAQRAEPFRRFLDHNRKGFPVSKIYFINRL